MSVRQFPPTTALSFGVVPPAPVSFGHAWWRINITNNNNGGSGIVAVAKLEMHAFIGGGDQCTGGTGISSTSFSTSFLPPNAFDALDSTCWASNGAALPQYLGYHFATNVQVNEILVESRDSGSTSQNPTAWDVQYSDDGVTWTTAWSNTSTAWGVNEKRTFHA